jgi:hypothetical protein
VRYRKERRARSTALLQVVNSLGGRERGEGGGAPRTPPCLATPPEGEWQAWVCVYVCGGGGCRGCGRFEPCVRVCVFVCAEEPSEGKQRWAWGDLANLLETVCGVCPPLRGAEGAVGGISPAGRRSRARSGRRRNAAVCLMQPYKGIFLTGCCSLCVACEMGKKGRDK